jgi:hypothetical protein
MSLKELKFPNQELREIEGAVNPVLAEHAVAIKALGKRVIADVIEIGARLTECKRICGHGNWLPWLEREFGWTDKTAENFINVHKLGGKFENFSNLDLPLSGLYLLAAPSTSDEARTEIIERAQAGERVPVAEVKRTIEAAKGRKQPAHKPRNPKGAKIHRETKLGEAVVKKLEGTSLDSARELDELVYLNRGAAPGTLTDIAKQFVEAAAAGRAVSAVVYKNSGAAFRREDLGPTNSGESAESPNGGDRRGNHHHVGDHENGGGGDAQVDALRERLRRQEFQITGLEYEIEELKAAKPTTESLARLTLPEFIKIILPSTWRPELEARVVEHLTAAQLVDALERRLHRDGINPAVQLQKIRSWIKQTKPQINLEATPAMGAA